jgi:lysophospholipase L1-like esterase
MLLFLGGCQQGGSDDLPKKPPQYLALGDSYTIGESVDASLRYPVQLAAMLRDAGIDLGEPQIIARTGWTTDELSRAMDAAQAKVPYRLVTLLIGVNNQFRGRSADEFRGQFDALLERAIELAGGNSAHVIVLSIPDWGVMPFAEGRDRAQIGREIDQFNAVCAEQCKVRSVALIDITPISRQATKDASLIAVDGLHPSGKQYEQWARAALPAAKAAVSR